ncbi:MAG: type II secretion system F family protein [Bdellovibrionaceae bacterium]|nr:type II secretion system F family protein [Pseudobdellovibrionaceae bacterium]
METFYYKARNRKGKSVKGEVLAKNITAAKKEISALDLIPIEVSKSFIHATISELNKIKDRFFNSIPSMDLLVFTQQLQVVYSVGIPLLRGLQVIEEQTENKVLKKTLQKIIVDVADGKQLFEAMSIHPMIFDHIYINMIRVGEASGQLEELLDRLYQIHETKASNSLKIKGALFYPKIVFFFIVIVNFSIVYFLIPKIKNFYDQLGGDLPAVTKALLKISDIVVNYVSVFFVLTVILFYGVKKALEQPKIRYMWDNIKLKLPIFGPLLLQVEMNSFCVVFGLLLKSGINVLQALEIVKKTLANQVIIKDLSRCELHVEAGKTIREGLEEGKAFPLMLKNLISIGEETGSLSEVLEKISKYYKMQMDYKMDNLSKAIEPILLAVIFAMVGFLAMAIFMPIWKMSSAVRGK